MRVPSFEALVEVQLRPGISDPAGATIRRALPALGFSGVSEVRAGKAFRLRVDAAGVDEARDLVEALSSRLLANPVIEEASVKVFEVLEAGAVGHAPASG
ncbi:MAG: phosphoribosylformylglycinamidine synthase subunit PurS [Actinobacteria bacterium]|nr:phosphoribosylformylglycinamidine synthase subunit PurS [Actinomycetota bacterium]